jgi:protein gp37
MVQNSKIEWTDHTFNPWIGCSKVSPACDHCYAEALMDHRYGRVQWGGDRVRTSASTWVQPLRWDRIAAQAGRMDTVFCLSLGDIWDKEADPLWRSDLFSLIERTPYLLWLLLSKRIGNAERMCDPLGGNQVLPSNAALGATMINQDEWDRDMPKLRRAGESLGARFTFVSVEPMLGPINARGDLPGWVIAGGESGQHARPMHPDWARSLRDQCAAADVPFFFKQWGEWGVAIDRERDDPDWRKDYSNDYVDFGKSKWLNLAGGCGFHGDRFHVMRKVGKAAAGRLLDGRTHDAMPEAA